MCGEKIIFHTHKCRTIMMMTTYNYKKKNSQVYTFLENVNVRDMCAQSVKTIEDPEIRGKPSQNK